MEYQSAGLPHLPEDRNPIVMVANSANPDNYISLVRRNHNFRYLWFGQIVSLLGDWFNLIASASLVAELTQSGVAIGGLFVVRMMAPFLISPFAGVAADRYNRKRLLILTDLGRAVTLVGFLLVREPEQVWLLYACRPVDWARPTRSRRQPGPSCWP
jgi:Na+/melibiose symporter-like transporter